MTENGHTHSPVGQPVYRAPVEVLPHRAPFLFLDRVLVCDASRLEGEVRFGGERDFFAGHFPGRPVVPGVLVTEAMAQALAYLVMTQRELEGVYLASIDGARYRKPVEPDTTVRIVVEVLQERLGFVKARGEAWVGKDLVAEAMLTGKGLPRQDVS